MNEKKTSALFVVCTIVTLAVAMPMPAAAEVGTGGSLIFYVDWGQSETIEVEMPFTHESELHQKAVLGLRYIAAVGEASYRVAVRRDPSVAFNLEVTNTSAVAQDFFSTIQFPINPLTANTLSAELLVDLIDTNANGQVALTGKAGGSNAIQAVTVTGGSVGPPLGATITTPGLHSFVLNPVSGPTPTGNKLFISTSFSLSPGDTAHITSQFNIDLGTGIPFAEIPDLPDAADGPFFNVIDVDSPETSQGNNFKIGAQTQLNLKAGGSIGTNFSAGDLLYLTPDVEVNMTGGVMGDDFRLFNESVANISGGTTTDVFMFNNSKLNVSGGNVGFVRLEGGTANLSAGATGGFRISEGNINITGGTVASGLFGFGVQADGGETTISGGTISNSTVIAALGGDVNISGGNFDSLCGICATKAAAGSVVNISGGEFTGSFASLSAIAGTKTEFNIFGGSFSSMIEVRGDNELHIFGTEFLLDGVPIEGLEYGEAFEITGRDVTLSATLANGSPLSIDLNSALINGQDHVSAAALLTVTLILPGDFNDNGVVDAADYVVWRNNLGSDTTIANDITPWEVGPSDYAIWKANFGNTAEGGAGALADESQAAVPEPATLVLLSFLAVGGCLWRCRAA